MDSRGSLLNFIAKCMIFNFVTWLIFFVIIRPIFFQGKTSAAELNQEAAHQAEEYSRQLDEAAKQSQMAVKQQEQMSVLLKRYEEQADRYDAVLSGWEKGVSKPSAPRP